jgi:hypothetical protein
MADDKQSFASKMMETMFSRGRATPLQESLSSITSNLNANFDRMLQGARAVTDPYIVSSLAHVDASLPFDRNAASIIQNFQTLDNKIRIVDKNVRVNTTLLQYNKRLMEATNASLNRAISESRNTDRRNSFQDSENKMEEGALNQAIDRRINEWMDAGLISGQNAGGAAAAGFAGGAAGAAAVGLGRLAATAATKVLPIALIAGFPQAMDNPDQNIYTDLGKLLDWTKTLVDPSYHGTEAQDLARSVVRKIKDYDTQLAKERMVKRGLEWWQRRKAEREYDRKYGGFYDPDYEYTDAEKKQMSEAAARREMEGAIARGNRTMGQGPTRRGRIRKDWKKTDGSDFGVERVPTPDEMKRLDIPDQLKVPGYTYPEKEPAPLLRLPTPDELKVPGYKYPIERVPDPKKVSSIFGRRNRGERIQVASLGDGHEFLPRNPEDAYSDRLSRFVESGETSLESVDQELDKFTLNSTSFNVRSRRFGFYSFSSFDLEAQGEIYVKSKAKITFEAPEIALVGKIVYSDIPGMTPYNTKIDPMNPHAAQNMPARNPASSSYDPSSPFGIMNGGGGRAPAPSWSNGGGGGGGGAGASVGGVAGSDRAAYAFQYFKSKGWTDAQAAGLVGNLMAESGQGLDSNARGDGGRAYGIAQWHPDRQANFQRAFGKSIFESTFEEQVAFVQWELDNTETKAANRLRSTNDAATAAAIVDQHYERSSGAHRSKRMEYASSIAGNVESFTNNPNAGSPLSPTSSMDGTYAGSGKGGTTVSGQEFRGTNGGMADLKMTNKSATRNDPITDDLRSKLQESVYAVYGPGYSVEVYSGGQEAAGEGGHRVGSTRHDHGNAGDVYVVGPDGKRVKGDRLGKLGQYWTAKGYGGVGLEMNGGGIHLDTHTDRAKSWNYGGGETKAAREAVELGKKGILPDGLYVAPDKKEPVAGLRLPQAPVKPVDKVKTATADELVKAGSANSSVTVNKNTTVVAPPAEPKKPTQNTHDNVNMSASGMLSTSSMIV